MPWWRIRHHAAMKKKWFKEKKHASSQLSRTSLDAFCWSPAVGWLPDAMFVRGLGGWLLVKSGGRGLEGNVADFYTADAESGAPAGMQAAAVVCALLELSAVTPVPYQKLQHTHTHTHTRPGPQQEAICSQATEDTSLSLRLLFLICRKASCLEAIRKAGSKLNLQCLHGVWSTLHWV